MFKTVGRIIRWCGDFRKRLYLGFLCSFLSHWCAAIPTMLAAYTVGWLITASQGGQPFDTRWIWGSFALIVSLVLLRFLFDYLRSRCQESISYELVAKDRLAIGDALKRVSLGYFQQMSTGSILNAITTGLGSLENMGIRMLESFVGGYLNFAVILLMLLSFSPVIALIGLAAAALSFVFLLAISRRSAKNAPRATAAAKSLSEAVLEYMHGLPTVKSFRQGDASLAALKAAVRDSRDSCLNIEFSYTPANCAHLLSLKIGSIAIALSACLFCLHGQMSFSMMLMSVFFSFSIFAMLEPISDSAHVLSVIDEAMDQMDALKQRSYIDADGKDISITHYDIAFQHVNFGYGDGRQVLKDVSFTIPEKSACAIVGPSGSGKSTLCNLLTRFYDVQCGSISVGGHDVRAFTCDSLLKNISMVFQNVYLFHDTVRANICFGKPDATEADLEAEEGVGRKLLDLRSSITFGDAEDELQMIKCTLCGGWYEAGNVFRNHLCSEQGAALSVVTDAKVNLRSGPGLTYEIIDFVPACGTYPMLSQAADAYGTIWYQVQYLEGTAWVSSVYAHIPC